MVFVVFFFILALLALFSFIEEADGSDTSVVIVGEPMRFSGAFCRNQEDAHRVLSLMQRGGNWQEEWESPRNSCGLGRLLVTPTKIVRQYMMEDGEVFTLMEATASRAEFLFFMFTSLNVKDKGKEA
jgi:hypothetical protein